MRSALDAARESVRRSGGPAVLIGSTLLFVALFLPWVDGASYRNAFVEVPAGAVLWATVAIWGVGLALIRARVEEPPGLAALAVFASLGLLCALALILSRFASTVGGTLGGGPSLALIGLVATLVGLWQVDRDSPASSSGHDEG